MPYIKQEIRKDLDPVIEELARRVTTFGDINYAITMLINRYLEINRGCFEPNYSDYNAMIGILECAKLEFYRRAVAIYENKKIIDNGDVYGQ